MPAREENRANYKTKSSNPNWVSANITALLRNTELNNMGFIDQIYRVCFTKWNVRDDKRQINPVMKNSSRFRRSFSFDGQWHVFGNH